MIIFSHNVVRISDWKGWNQVEGNRWFLTTSTGDPRSWTSTASRQSWLVPIHYFLTSPFPFELFWPTEIREITHCYNFRRRWLLSQLLIFKNRSLGSGLNFLAVLGSRPVCTHAGAGAWCAQASSGAVVLVPRSDLRVSCQMSWDTMLHIMGQVGK